MRVTAKVDYALRAALELTEASRARPMKGDAVARSQDIPLKYLENILVELRRAGIVASLRGAEGGYWLATSPEQVSIADVIRAVEGPLANVRGERPEALEYQGKAVVLRELWVATRAALRSVLERTTLADLAAGELPPEVKPWLDVPEAWQAH